MGEKKEPSSAPSEKGPRPNLRTAEEPSAQHAETNFPKSSKYASSDLPSGYLIPIDGFSPLCHLKLLLKFTLQHELREK